MRGLLVIIASLSLSQIGVGLGQVAQPQDPLTLKQLSSDARSRTDEGLNLTVDRVKSAFVEGDTAKLTDCIGSRKVYVSLKSQIKDAGYYTRSQIQFIFDKIFQELKTRSFEYSPKDDVIQDEGRAYFRSGWTYVELGSDNVVTEQLHFTFEKEKDGWRISEIRASSK